MSEESKVTARVAPVVYNKVKDHFHHGQQTQFFRKVFESLKVLIDAGRFNEVTDYLYSDKDLTLPLIKENQKIVTPED
jgi:hypothetical protein